MPASVPAVGLVALLLVVRYGYAISRLENGTSCSMIKTIQRDRTHAGTRRTCLPSHRAAQVSCLLLLSVMGCGRPEPDPPPLVSAPSAAEERFQSGLDHLRRTAEFPGATAAYVLADGVTRAFATGVADREAREPMLPAARMLSGSTGKSFVAALVVALAQDALVDLDAPISRWLAAEPWFDWLPNAQDITLRILLQHTSGLPDHVHAARFMAAVAARMIRRGRGAFLTPEESISFVLDADPLFLAGESYRYTDTGYLVVGLIIERATGRTFYEELERRFLNPLDLHFTSPANGRYLPGLVPGYVPWDNPVSRLLRLALPRKIAGDEMLAYNPATEWTGGGLVTNVRDLASWARVLYEGEAMAAPYLDDLLAGVPKDARQQALHGPDIRYGLGVDIRMTDLGPAYGHSGWTPGYLSIFAYYPVHRAAVALQINELGRYDLSAYVHTLANTLLEGER